MATKLIDHMYEEMRTALLKVIESSGLHQHLTINGYNLSLYYKPLIVSLTMFVPNCNSKKALLHYLLQHSSLFEVCRGKDIVLDGYDLELEEKFLSIMLENTQN